MMYILTKRINQVGGDRLTQILAIDRSSHQLKKRYNDHVRLLYLNDMNTHKIDVALEQYQRETKYKFGPYFTDHSSDLSYVCPDTNSNILVKIQPHVSMLLQDQYPDAY